MNGTQAPNVSRLADEIQTSRATVMNYIKNLADARLINIMYHAGDEFPKKPSKIMMHNSNLMFPIYSVTPNGQDICDTFFVNTLWKDHKVNIERKANTFLVDDKLTFKIYNQNDTKLKYYSDEIHVLRPLDVGRDNRIPLWLFGFLY
jgi:predicted AAA+ superfamily ATPase